MIAGRGRRSTTLVLRLDTRAPDTRRGLLWRADATQACGDRDFAHGSGAA